MCSILLSSVHGYVYNDSYGHVYMIMVLVYEINKIFDQLIINVHFNVFIKGKVIIYSHKILRSIIEELKWENNLQTLIIDLITHHSKHHSSSSITHSSKIGLSIGLG